MCAKTSPHGKFCAGVAQLPCKIHVQCPCLPMLWPKMLASPLKTAVEMRASWPTRVQIHIKTKVRVQNFQNEFDRLGLETVKNLWICGCVGQLPCISSPKNCTRDAAVLTSCAKFKRNRWPSDSHCYSPES